VRKAWQHVEPAVFLSSAAAVVAIVLFGVLRNEAARGLFIGAQQWIVHRLEWLFVASTALFLVFAIAVCFGPTGAIRLGADDERPRYGRLSWFAMLFSAGMGIGILFYGVAEPILHYANPPRGVAETPAAAARAMTITFFHWGLHAWGVYAVMGLAIAYFAHRRGLPMAVRSTLHPLIGERIHGPIGHGVDTLAVFGTLFGLATSLGLGAMQINAGLAHLFGAPQSTTVQVILIAVITAGATTSLLLGLDRGIRRLSELNLALAGVLLAFVLAAGPTTELLWAFPSRVAAYLLALVPLSLEPSRLGDADWRGGWTIFYWAWWIAWAPFVGTFVARISRGRTVREFVLGVLLVPSVVSFAWFTVFGWSAIQLEGEAPGIALAVQENVATGVYALLERLPLAGFSSLLAALVVAVFFITSSDSGSFVVDMLTSGGHPNPPVWQRVFWAVSEGLVAAVLVMAGGLRALQAAAIDTGLPFCIVLLFVCAGLAIALRDEVRGQRVETRITESPGRRERGSTG
jgi:choline/glycine/proline betaine transport protein